MIRALVVLSALLLGVAAGCGDDEALPPETTQARVYFLLDGQVWPTAREVADDDVAGAVVNELVAGPSDEERDEMGLTSAFPDGVEVSVANGVATVETDAVLSTEQLAQLVYSLTAISDDVEGAVVGAVDVGGHSYTRDDFEDQTPSVLVESPLPFESVRSPITLSGTANTFEATFHYELLDANGTVLDDNFVTATSGTGTRGTFEQTAADVDGVAALVVFEESAEDGSRMREVEIPLTEAS